MTLTYNSFRTGMVVTVTGDTQGSGHGFDADTKVTVTDIASNDVYVRDQNNLDRGSRWVYFADISIDPNDLDLDGFKALVVAKAKDAAKIHGWCEVVDSVLKDLGLEKFLPREQYVDVTFRVKVSQPTGSADYAMTEAAEQQVVKSIKDGSLYYPTKVSLVEQ